MSIRDFRVNLSPEEAATMIQEWVVNGSLSGTLIDHYERQVGESKIIVFILEKYYMRSSNRASLTVTIDNLTDETKVHAVAAGSSEGIMRFDWGAGKNFSQSVENALGQHIISVIE